MSIETLQQIGRVARFIGWAAATLLLSVMAREQATHAWIAIKDLREAA